MLTAGIVQLNSRKCNMTAFTGCVGERTHRFLKEILFFHYFYVCCSHKNGPKCFERIINMVAIWHCELVAAAVCMCLSVLVCGIWPIRTLSWSQAAKWLSVFFCCSCIPYRVKPFRLYFKVQYAPLRR